MKFGIYYAYWEQEWGGNFGGDNDALELCISSLGVPFVFVISHIMM